MSKRRARTLPAKEFAEMFRPGSYDPPWSWGDEVADLFYRERAAMMALLEDVRMNGIRQPVSVGDDGRVWDGHHRVCAALLLGADVPFDDRNAVLP